MRNKFDVAMREARPIAEDLLVDLEWGPSDSGVLTTENAIAANGERASAAEIRSRKTGRVPNAPTPDAASYDVEAKDPNWKDGGK